MARLELRCRARHLADITPLAMAPARLVRDGALRKNVATAGVIVSVAYASAIGRRIRRRICQRVKGRDFCRARALAVLPADGDKAAEQQAENERHTCLFCTRECRSRIQKQSLVCVWVRVSAEDRDRGQAEWEI